MAISENNQDYLPKPLFSRIPAVGGVLSIIPGLGQIYAGYITRGILLLFIIASMYGVSYWRVALAEVDTDISIAPPRFDIEDDLSRPQQRAVNYALMTSLLITIAYLWNIYDGYCCAQGNPAPARMAMGFITLATLIIGMHITEVDIKKAFNEVDDVRPRLMQILMPWDNVWYREEEIFEGEANWRTPCGDEPDQPTVEEGQPAIVVTPTCGTGSGLRLPNGSRQEGTTVAVSGTNFLPNESAEILVRPGSGAEFRVVVDGERLRVTADENGTLNTEFVMPNLNLPFGADNSNVIITIRQSREIGSLLIKDDVWEALDKITVTLFVALLATAVGLVLSVPLSFLAARNLMSANIFVIAIYYIVRLVMNVIRSIEPLVWALIAVIWIGPGPFAGMIALTVHTIASLAKLYSEAIESIDPGPIEALQATGANRLQTIIYAVVPQVIPPFVSFTIYRWDINVRMSTIIGAVGGGGIGFFLFEAIRTSNYDKVGIAVWMIAIVVTILDYASARIREKYI